MQKKIQNLDKFLILILSLALCWLTLEGLIGIRFTNYDDMWFSVAPFGDYFSVAGEDAKNTGRFGMYYATIYLLITSKLWNTPLFDIAMYGSVVLVLVSILALTRFLGNVFIGLLFTTLYLTFIPVTYGFNLLVSYPFRYTSGILLWIFSIYLFEKYFRTHRRSFLYLACGILFISFTHHEVLFAIFSLCSFIFILLRGVTGPYKERLLQKPTQALLLTCTLYILVFAIWYATHPTVYAGNKINFSQTGFISGYIQSIQYYIGASLPLFHYFHGYALPFIPSGDGNLFSAISVAHDYISVLGNIDSESIIRSMLAGVIFVYSVSKINKAVNSKLLIGIFFVGMLTLVLPAGMVSMSSAYQGYVRGGYAPLHVTFFGYFGSILLIATLIIYIIGIVPPGTKKIITYGFAIVIMLGALVSSAFNSDVVNAMKMNTSRWNAMSLLMQYYRLPINAVNIPRIVIAPQLWNVAGSPGELPNNYWQRLFTVNNKVDIEFYPKRLPNTPNSSYMLYYSCPLKRDCMLLLQHGEGKAIELISTTSQPRFLTYIRNNGTEAEMIKAVPTPQQNPTLLLPGIFSTFLPLNVTEISRLRLDI